MEIRNGRQKWIKMKRCHSFSTVKKFYNILLSVNDSIYIKKLFYQTRERPADTSFRTT